MHCQNAILDTNEFPLVSVIVPAYNAQQYIGATLQSLMCQSYPHLEIIVTDDGSTDYTVEIVKKAISNDRRIKLVQQANHGVAAARNLAIHHSRGSYIAPVDADDICFPDKIAKLLGTLEKGGKNSGLAYSWSAIINQNGHLIGKGPMPEFEGRIFEYLLFSNFIGNASAVLIRKKCFDSVGLYNTTFFSQKAQGCEDYDIYLRIAEQFEFKLVKEFLTGYRKTGETMSDNYKAMDRSMQLVIRNQMIRNPWIPSVVLNWAFAYFSLWLSSLAANRGCYYDSIAYLIRAGWYDPWLIKNRGYIIRVLNRFKQGFENLLPTSCSHNIKRKLLYSTQCTLMNKGNLSIEDFEKISGLNLKGTSPITPLKEKRRMIAYNLLRKARIRNDHLVQ